MPNPTYQQIADFSSAGPRYGDNWLKPDVAAPGVNVFSSLVGTGWDGAMYSGTSMATPMTSGMAALVLSVHPGWSPLKVKAAIVNTADASSAKIIDYDPLLAGSGVAQVNRAVARPGSSPRARAPRASRSATHRPTAPTARALVITLHNTSASAITYNLAGASIVSVSPASVTVAAGAARHTVTATASLSAVQLAGTLFASNSLGASGSAWGGVNTFRGAVVATPTTSGRRDLQSAHPVHGGPPGPLERRPRVPAPRTARAASLRPRSR